MKELELNEFEIAPASVVKQTARDFAAALAETLQFKAFEEAGLRFQKDEAAQKAMLAYQQKHKSLQMMLRLNAVSPQEQAELERLQKEWLAYATVKDYFQAQNDLVALCQDLGDKLSESTGLNYSASCGVSCCG